jgi:hypothetical protein
LQLTGVDIGKHFDVFLGPYRDDPQDYTATINHNKRQLLFVYPIAYYAYALVCRSLGREPKPIGGVAE